MHHFWSETVRGVSVRGEDPGNYVVEQPVHSCQQVLPSDCTTADDAPVVSLDLVQAQCLEDMENTSFGFLLQIPPNKNQTKSVSSYLQLGQISPREWPPWKAHLVNPACWQTPTTLHRLTSGRRRNENKDLIRFSFIVIALVTSTQQWNAVNTHTRTLPQYAYVCVYTVHTHTHTVQLIIELMLCYEVQICNNDAAICSCPWFHIKKWLCRTSSSSRALSSCRQSSSLSLSALSTTHTRPSVLSK